MEEEKETKNEIHLFEITKEKLKPITEIISNFGNEVIFEFTETGITILSYEGICFNELKLKKEFFIFYSKNFQDIFSIESNLLMKIINKCGEKIDVFIEENAYLIIRTEKKEYKIRLLEPDISKLEASKEFKEVVSPDKEYFTFNFVSDANELIEKLSDLINEDNFIIEFLQKTKYIQLTDFDEKGTGCKSYFKPKKIEKEGLFHSKFQTKLFSEMMKNLSKINNKVILYGGLNTPIYMTSNSINVLLTSLIAPIVENVD